MGVLDAKKYSKLSHQTVPTCSATLICLDHARIGERVHGPAAHGVARSDVRKNQGHKACVNRLVSEFALFFANSHTHCLTVMQQP